MEVPLLACRRTRLFPVKQIAVLHHVTDSQYGNTEEPKQYRRKGFQYTDRTTDCQHLIIRERYS
jgi:hypothetical protein